MNVDSVSIVQALQVSSSQSSSSTLTATQQALIEETLAQYDVENLSQNDAKAIVETFSEAGITPSYALESAMASAGFDAKEVGTLAGVGGAESGKGPMGGPPPPPPSDEELSTIEELLESLLYADSEEESEDGSTVSSSFESIMDYTNKIVRLNDDAKTEVMDILNNYSSEENTLSQEDTQAYIINSLRQVLNDPDNFNTTSFYA